MATIARDSLGGAIELEQTENDVAREEDSRPLLDYKEIQAAFIQIFCSL